MVDNKMAFELTDMLDAVISQVEEREALDGLSVVDLAELELMRSLKTVAERGEFIEWHSAASKWAFHKEWSD